MHLTKVCFAGKKSQIWDFSIKGEEQLAMFNQKTPCQANSILYAEYLLAHQKEIYKSISTRHNNVTLAHDKDYHVLKVQALH